MLTAAQAAISQAHAASLVVALAAGCAFLCVGWRLLGLLAALAGAALGWWVGVLISAVALPGASLLIAGIIGGVVGALLGAAFLKLAIAGGAGLLGAVTIPLLALMLAERGIVPLDSPAPVDSAVTAPTISPRVQCAELLNLSLAALRSQMTPGETGAAAQLWWQAAQPPVRTLITAAAIAGGAMAFALALLAHKHAAAVCSAGLGATLILAAGFPLLSWASRGAVAVPNQVAAWLLLGIALTIVGWVLQTRAMARAATAPAKATS